MKQCLKLLSKTGSLLYLVTVFVFIPTTTYADSYQVSANINFPPPTQAAVIDGSIDNVTVTNTYFTVFGTCQIANPAHIIVIKRNNLQVASGACDASGGFSINISLVNGANTLVAQTVNVSSLYGPDSSPITVSLTLPPNPEPETSGQNTPANGPRYESGLLTTDKTTQTALNEGVRSNLQISSEKPFSILNNKGEATITIIIDGGSSPFNIFINWGDGSNETKFVEKNGAYTFNHSYSVSGIYRVLGEVRDNTGAISRFEYAAGTAKVTPTNLSLHASTPNNFKPSDSINYLGFMMAGAILAVSLSSFILGRISMGDTRQPGRIKHGRRLHGDETIKKKHRFNH